MTYHGLTQTVYGTLVTWSLPDGTVRIAQVVFREGGRNGEAITPPRWEIVNAGTLDPATAWAEAVRVGTLFDSATGEWSCSCSSFFGPIAGDVPKCLVCGTVAPPTRPAPITRAD